MSASTSVHPDASPTYEGPPDRIPYDLIELLFFAYRDFVGDPDRILLNLNFGRAHHRVLHFVERRPGLTIAELLDILQITKQSLNRVLKDLVETGFVEQRPGREDRRQRRLHTTVKGHDLADQLARLQGARITRALERAGVGNHDIIRAYLQGMIDMTNDTPAGLPAPLPDPLPLPLSGPSSSRVR